MPKQLVSLSNAAINMAQFNIGQGVSPELQEYPETAVTSAVGSYPVLFQSGAGDLMGAASGSISGVDGFCYWTDPFDLTTGKKISTPSFSGAIYCGAASSDLLAIGGTNPFIYVLSRTDLSLKTVSTTGLGNVVAVNFSPDGSLMAVLHINAPYLRIYKTSDWTFSNVLAAVQPNAPTAQIKGMAFSSDGKKLVVASVTNVGIYNPLTLERLSNSASLGAGQVIVTKRNPNEAFMAVSGASSPCAARINLTTGVVSNVTGAPNFHGYSVALDERERALYVALNSISGDIYIRKFNADTLQELPIERGSIHQMVRASNAALIIVETTPHRISGSVRDIGNLPVQRTVHAYDRATGKLVAKTASDSVTGNYDLRTYTEGPFDVQFKSKSGELLNDLFYAKVMAEPIA